MSLVQCLLGKKLFRHLNEKLIIQNKSKKNVPVVGKETCLHIFADSCHKIYKFLQFGIFVRDDLITANCKKFTRKIKDLL